MDEINVEKNILSLDNISVITKYPIKKVEKLNNKYVVLLKIPRVELGFEELNNILCFDENGNKCWQISNNMPSDIISKEQMPYVAIQVMDEKLYATDFWGRRFYVDIDTGRLIDVKIVH